MINRNNRVVRESSFEDYSPGDFESAILRNMYDSGVFRVEKLVLTGQDCIDDGKLLPRIK